MIIIMMMMGHIVWSCLHPMGQAGHNMLYISHLRYACRHTCPILRGMYGVCTTQYAKITLLVGYTLHQWVTFQCTAYHIIPHRAYYWLQQYYSD